MLSISLHPAWPYVLAMAFMVAWAYAGFVVWRVPDTWEATQNLTWPRTLIALLLFVLALVVLRTQEYNPFIYFIF